MSTTPTLERDEAPKSPSTAKEEATHGITHEPRARIIRDSAIVAYRNLLTILRVPTLLVTATIQPLMFVFLFAYIFGASLGGGQYREFLLAGIFTQTVAFNAAFTTVGLAGDLHKGIIDRMRTLPMSRLAVLMGRTLSDLVVNILSLAVMVGCGYTVGWRINGGIADAALAFGVILLFAFAMSWVGALTGLLADRRGSPERGPDLAFPAHVHLLRLHLRRGTARPAAHRRRMEPDHRGLGCGPKAVRQRRATLVRPPDRLGGRALHRVRRRLLAADPCHRRPAGPAALPEGREPLADRAVGHCRGRCRRV